MCSQNTDSISGTCFEVDTCTDGEKFADRSDCEHYFLCSHNNLIHQRCQIGLVFYINQLDCAPPSPGFNCGYRCPTTVPDSTQMEMSTTPMVTTGMISEVDATANQTAITADETASKSTSIFTSTESTTTRSTPKPTLITTTQPQPDQLRTTDGARE